MSPETQSAQTPHEAPSAQKRVPSIVLTLLPVCCMCGLIRDETGSSPGFERWLTPRTYRKTRGVNPVDFSLTHTYCPTCFTKVQETTAQHFRQIGTSP